MKGLILHVLAGRFPGEGGVVAPGMSCKYTVHFAPDSLGDFEDFLVVETQAEHMLVVPIAATRPPPVLTCECHWHLPTLCCCNAHCWYVSLWLLCSTKSSGLWLLSDRRSKVCWVPVPECWPQRRDLLHHPQESVASVEPQGEKKIYKYMWLIR